MTRTPLEVAAHDYLSAGLTVIALSGKLPNKEFHRRGLLDSIEGVPEDEDDNELIRTVFAHPDTTGIGIVIVYPMFVVDVDGEEGAIALSALLSSASLDDTPVARTGRGLHVWYIDPKERHSTNLGQKLDVKGPGGYVAAPPSQHFDEDGRPDFIYTWLDPLVDDVSGQRAGIEWAPTALTVALDAKDQLASDIAANRAAMAVDWGERSPLMTVEVSAKGWRIKRDISGLVKGVANTKPGERNNYLAWAAMAARDDGVPAARALSDLTAAAVVAGLTQQEATTTIKAAYRRRRKT